MNPKEQTPVPSRQAEGDPGQRDKETLIRAPKAVPHGEADFRGFFDTIDDFLFVLDARGVIQHVNKTVTSRLGYPEADLLGKTVLAVHPPERHEEASRIVADMLAGTSGSCPVPLQAADGRLIPVETRVVAGQWHGQPALFGVSRDITERNQAESALRESEERYQALFARSLHSVFVSDFNGKFLDANQAALDLLGYRREDISGLTFASLLTPDQLPLAMQVTEEIRATGQQKTPTEFRLRCKDGGMVNVETQSSLIYRDGKPLAIQGIGRDITERKRAEQQLGESEDRFRRLHESLRDAFIQVEMNGRLQSWNAAYRDMLGYTDEELRELAYVDLTPEKWHAMEARIVAEQVMTHDQSEVYEKEYIRKDGTIFPVELRTFLLRNKDGQPEGMWAIVRDITERKRVERVLAESEYRYRGLADRLPLAVQVYSPEGVTLRVNDAWERMWQVPFSSLKEYNVLKDQQLESLGILRLLRKAFDGQAVEFPVHEYDKQQTPSVSVPSSGKIWIRAFAYPVLGADGQLLEVVVIQEDVTERKHAEAALQESERRFRQLFDSSPDPVWIIDNHYFVECNQAAVSLLGYPNREALQNTHPSALSPDYQPDGEHSFAKAERMMNLAQEKGLHRFEWVHQRWDGSCFLAEVTLSAVMLGGRPVIHCLWRDITERKRAQEMLQESANRLIEAQRIAKVGSWELDLVHDRLAWSDEIFRLFEIDPGRFGATYEAFLNAIHPDDRDAVNAAYSRSLQTREPYSITHRLLMPDGRIKHVHEQCVTEFDPDGKPLRSFGTVQDISDQVASQEALHRSMAETERLLAESDRMRRNALSMLEDQQRAEQEIRRLLDEATEREFFLRESQQVGQLGGWRADPVNNKMTWTQGVYELVEMPLDYKPDLEAALDAYLPDSRVQVVENLKRTLETGVPFSIQVQVRGAQSGIAKWTELRGHPHRDTQGRIDYLIGTIQDITSRKRAEEEKEKLQSQLSQAQKMESVGRLAGGVAHDFNNMLGVILGHAEMALGRVDPGQPLFADLLEVRKAAERSADLTSKLLAFARKQTVAPKVLDLNETVEGMLTLLRRLIGEDIDLAWQPGENLAPVRVDPSQLDQILANLCVNARDAIVDVGTITIETGAATFDEAYCAEHAGFVPGEYVLLAVSDNGCGMDAETVGHLFEPFFTTKALGKGTGLGLASVYGAVKQNHGFINVYSEPGHGTTFTIYLPRHAARTVQPAENGSEAPVTRGHETILLVEDEPAILRMTAKMLAREGYTVIAAGTPGEAIRLAREHTGPIHLLMTDVVMPEMNGRDLARNLLSIHPGIKRIFMSGYTANVIAHHGVLDEGVHFIQKPISMKGLAAHVREALHRA